MSFNLTESAKWAQANQKIIGDLRTGVDKALAEAASRGFPAPPGTNACHHFISYPGG